jgi:hypothetical protein
LFTGPLGRVGLRGLNSAEKARAQEQDDECSDRKILMKPDF